MASHVAKSKDHETIRSFFTGYSALCIYNHRIIRIDDVVFNINLHSKFPDSKFKNFKEYFEKQYNAKFKYPNQFLVVNKKKIRENENGKIKVTIQEDYFPPELLLPTGLTDQMRKNWRVMKDLGKITIAFPDQKFKKVQQGLDRLEDGKD